MDTWIKYGQYGLGFVLLIIFAYSGVQLGVDWLSESLNELKKEINTVYKELGKTQEKVGQLSKNVESLDSQKLTCEAIPREEFQEEFASCAADYYKLAEWCSGDCNADDARVTLCCKYK